jgi:hypothetical protein
VAALNGGRKSTWWHVLADIDIDGIYDMDDRGSA